MKKLFFILLFPCFAQAQCPQWIKGSRDSVINLFKVADQYLQFDLMKSFDTSQQGKIRLTDPHSYCILQATFYKENVFQGNDLVSKFTTANHITIQGPTDRMDKFLNEYLMPAIEKCDTKKGPQWIYFGKTLMVIRTDATNPIKSIDMDYKETAP
jgi:hypothetical protein